MLIILAIISCLNDSLYYGMGSYSTIESKKIGNLYNIYRIIIPMMIGIVCISFITEVIIKNKEVLTLIKQKKVNIKQYILGYVAQVVVNLIKVWLGRIIIYIIMMLSVKAFRNNSDMVNYELCVTLMSVHIYFVLVFWPSILFAVTDIDGDNLINLQKEEVKI